MIKIYCDGSGSVEGKPIGFASVITEDNEVIDIISDNGKVGTSNIAELKAAILSIEWIKENKPKEVEIYSDSLYIVKGINEWMKSWRQVNFVFTKNKELWKHINSLINRDLVRFKIHHVKGHQKDKKNMDFVFNNLADKISREERLKIKVNLK